MELILQFVILCRGGSLLLSFLYTSTTFTKPSTGVTQEPTTQKEGNDIILGLIYAIASYQMEFTWGVNELYDGVHGCGS